MIKKGNEAMIKGAIFDMDGTLVDSLAFWDYFYAECGRRYGMGEDFRPEEETEKRIRTLSFKEGMALMHDVCQIGGSAEELLEMAFDRCVTYYSEIVTVKDGVMDFLRLCRDRGVKTCVASATQSDLLRIVMERFGLYEYLPRVFSCGDIGVGKDRPDIFLLALEYLGTDKDETYIFEDSVVAVETAVRAGFKTVGIYDKYGFSHDRIRELSAEYIAEGETLMKLKGRII